MGLISSTALGTVQGQLVVIEGPAPYLLYCRALYAFFSYGDIDISRWTSRVYYAVFIVSGGFVLVMPRNSLARGQNLSTHRIVV